MSRIERSRRPIVKGPMRKVIKDFYWRDLVQLECGHEVERGRHVGLGTYDLPIRKHCPFCKR